jgi:hypothetical protein
VIEKHRRMPPTTPAPSTWARWCGGNSAIPPALDWAGQGLGIDPQVPVRLYDVACVYSFQGKVEQALDCLENAVKHGFAHRAWIEHDTDLSALHGHPRNQAMLERLQSPTARTDGAAPGGLASGPPGGFLLATRRPRVAIGFTLRPAAPLPSPHTAVRNAPRASHAPRQNCPTLDERPEPQAAHGL